MRLDQLSDVSNLQLYRLLQGVELPDFVKDAALDDETTVADLEKSAYADEVNIAYPINTPARVYVSNAFFQSKKAAYEDRFGTAHTKAVEERIKGAAELFSISHEIERYNEAHEKRANRDYEIQHVCTIQDDELGEQNIFPYRTADEFRKSAEVFDKNIGKYPFEWRTQIAQGFLSKAAEVGVDELPDLICKYAGLFYPGHTADIAREVARRANRLSSKTASDQLKQLASAVSGFENFESIDDVMKIAEIVYRVEQQDGAYDRPKTAEVLPDPVDSFFIHSPEKVAQILNVVDMGGEKFNLDALQKISSDKYKEAFGVDIDPSNEVQLRDILPTMPLSDVALFRELTGVQPV
jgi:hypothetical protein